MIESARFCKLYKRALASASELSFRCHGECYCSECMPRCPICLKVFGSQYRWYGILSCNHVFCSPCIDKWRNHTAVAADQSREVFKSCPLCRMPSSELELTNISSLEKLRWGGQAAGPMLHQEQIYSNVKICNAQDHQGSVR